MILDAAVSDVAALAREGKGIEEKKRWAVREAERLEKVKKADEQSMSHCATQLESPLILYYLCAPPEIHRLQTIHGITQHISSLSSNAITPDAKDPLDPFTDDFTKLIEDFREEYDEYDLDEVVVGAISQVVSNGTGFASMSSLITGCTARAHVQGLPATRRFGRVVQDN